MRKACGSCSAASSGVINRLTPWACGAMNKSALRANTRRARYDDVVDIAALGGRERRQEAVLVFTMPLSDINKAFDLMHAGKSIRSAMLY